MARRTSENISNWAAYLRYFGVEFFGKGHFLAQVPSNISVMRARVKMIKAASGEPSARVRPKRASAKINLVKVNKSAK